MKRLVKRVFRVVLPVLLAGGVAVVSGSTPGADESSVPPPHEYTFAKIIYTNFGGNLDGYRRRNSWYTDSPAAEAHFMQGVRRLTRIDADSQATYIKLTEDRLFNYPFLYAVEVGHWALDDKECELLREYLLRGGFLMVDDFHGTQEWEVFMDSMRRVFPDRSIVEIGNQEEVLHVLYDLDQRIQIPGLTAVMRGMTYEKDGYTPHWRGIYDDDGRLMVSINFNMDMGDAWEHADNPIYPQPMTALAYRFGINYIIYSMTH